MPDVSGTITTGGTAQQLVGRDSNRRALFIQNVSANDLWISEVGTAAASQPSIRIDAGATFRADSEDYEFGLTNAISIFGGTTGQQFSARVG